MKNLDNDTSVIHEKMRKHFTPLNGHVLIEFVENLKTSGGIYLPVSSEETKSIAHPVVATGTDLVKPGEWVSLSDMQVQVFKMYNRKFAIIRDFSILMKVDMEYIKDEANYKELFKQSKTTVN